MTWTVEGGIFEVPKQNSGKCLGFHLRGLVILLSAYGLCQQSQEKVLDHHFAKLQIGLLMCFVCLWIFSLNALNRPT